jgi:hypothetical protein
MLNEHEQDRIQLLLNDAMLMDTVKKIFSIEIEKSFPRVEAMEDNQLLGEKYRAYHEAKAILGLAFLSMNSYRREPKDEKIINRAN